MAAKKIEIVYDINGKPIDVAIDKTLNLQQQAKALTAELRRTKEGSDEFKLLSTRLGDAQDGLAKTTAKSKDLFSTLSLLPGPVGDFFTQLSGSIELLKIFSSFSLKDIGFQLKEVAGDVGDIAENLVGLNEAQEVNTAVTEAQTAAVEELAVAENAAAVSSEVTTVAIEGQTVATEAAEVATVGLGAALKAIGIGLLIAGIAVLIAYWDDLKDAIMGTSDATRAYDQLQKKSIDNSTAQIVELDKLSTAVKKGGLTQREKNQAVNEYNKTLGDTLGKVTSYIGLEEKLTDPKRVQAYKDMILQKAIAEGAYQLVVEKTKEKLKTMAEQAKQSDRDAAGFLTNLSIAAAASEGSVDITKATSQAGKQAKKDLINEFDDIIKFFNGKMTEAMTASNKAAAAAGLAIPKIEYTGETTNKVEKKDYQDKEIIKRAEDLRKQLLAVQIEGEKERARAEIIADGERQAREIRAMEVNPKNPIAIKKKEELIADTIKQAELKALESDKKFDEDFRKQKEEALKKLLELEVKSIQDEAAITKVERYNQYLEDERLLKESYDKKLITQTQYEEGVKNAHTAMVNDNQKIDDDAATKANEKLIARLQAELQVLDVEQKTKLEGTVEYYDGLRAIEDKAYEIKKAKLDLSQTELDAIEKEHAQNRVNITKAEQDAKRQILLQTLGLYQQFGASLQQLAGKNKGLAIAGILIEKAAGIASIIINTNAAVAKAGGYLSPLGIATAVAGAASVATSIMAANKAVNEINGSADSSSGSGGSSGQNLGRNYADGGMIGGRRHAQGGTIIEAEAGEAIMTRNAVTMFAPLLSMMNQAGGGVAFSPNAMVSSYDNPKPSNETSSTAIIKTYVVSNDMTSSQEKNARLKNLSTL